jgi:hypothetical protein
MATRRSAEEVQRLLEGFRQSGESRTAFCRRLGIPVTTLDYYRYREARQARPRLARVKLTAPSADPTATFALVLRNGRRIETNWNFRDADLARLIRIVDSQ